MRTTSTTTPWYILAREWLWKRLELHALGILLPSNANSKCGGGMSTPSSSHAYSLSWFGNGVGSCFLLQKKRVKLPWWQCQTLHHQTIMVSTLIVLLLTLNKALLGGRPRITRFVLMLISVWIKLNHASCFLYLFLYALVWMCVRKHIHRRFNPSMVFGLKCLLWSNWHGVKFDGWTSELILV